MGVLDVFDWQGLALGSGSVETESPAWTRLDNLGRGGRLYEVTIRRGRQDEFERTQTGTLTAKFKDATGAVDPTANDWISRPIAWAVRNPIDGEWYPRFRGLIDDHSYDLSPGRTHGDVTIEAVDLLDYLSNVELVPGWGDPPPAQSAGYVFYDDTAVTGPQIRINQVFSDLGYPSGLTSVFTGNVNLLPTVYSPGESLMAVIDDACDAEFPGVANRFVDKFGVFCFHGRLARFDPASVAATATHWDYHEWTAGASGAELRWPFRPTRSRRMIRNAALAYPHYVEAGQRFVVFPVADRELQVVEDATSQNTHGIRNWSAENLITKEGITSGLTGPEECLTFANYIVQNYKDPQTRLEQITLRPKKPGHPRAAANWAMACQADISDSVTVVIDHPGAGGTSITGFIEGITERWWYGADSLDSGWPMFEITYDISPAAYWSTEPELPEA